MNRTGSILISHPKLSQESWFHKTVVYIYNDDDEYGTLGICLNKPSGVTISDLYYEQGMEYFDDYTQVNRGGPLHNFSLIMLHSNDWECDNTMEAGSDLMVTSDHAMFDRLTLGDQPKKWRLFLGVSAWMPGQLDLEMTGKYPYRPENSWLTAVPDQHLIFDYDGEDQWLHSLEVSSRQMIDFYFG